MPGHFPSEPAARYLAGRDATVDFAAIVFAVIVPLLVLALTAIPLALEHRP